MQMWLGSRSPHCAKPIAPHQRLGGLDSCLVFHTKSSLLEELVRVKLAESSGKHPPDLGLSLPSSYTGKVNGSAFLTVIVTRRASEERAHCGSPRSFDDLRRQLAGDCPPSGLGSARLLAPNRRSLGPSFDSRPGALRWNLQKPGAFRFFRRVEQHAR